MLTLYNNLNTSVNSVTDKGEQWNHSFQQQQQGLLSYFFVKKISLSRRDEYVVDGSMDQ